MCIRDSYNSTSVAQREQVFKKSKEEIMKIAVDGAKLLKTLASETDGNFTFQYSPESFPGTEVDYAVDVCNAVLDIWEPTKEKKAIINIPVSYTHLGDRFAGIPFFKDKGGFCRKRRAIRPDTANKVDGGIQPNSFSFC